MSVVGTTLIERAGVIPTDRRAVVGRRGGAGWPVGEAHHDLDVLIGIARRQPEKCEDADGCGLISMNTVSCSLPPARSGGGRYARGDHAVRTLSPSERRIARTPNGGES